MHGFSSLILSSILSAILPELGLCITDRAFLNVCNVGHDSGQRVQLAWVMLRLLVLVPWAAQAFPCTNTTSISCPTSPTAWQPPNRVHVAIRGEAFRGLTYGGPHKRAHACRGESETIQVAIARAQLLHIVEPLERRNIHVDISLHTYSCHDVVNDVAEAQRLEHVLVDAYKHGRDRRVTLRIQPRENLAAHIPVRDAASFAAESAAAAVLIWRFDVIPGAEVRFAPSGTVPFVTSRATGDLAIRLGLRHAPRESTRLVATPHRRGTSRKTYIASRRGWSSDSKGCACRIAASRTLRPTAKTTRGRGPRSVGTFGNTVDRHVCPRSRRNSAPVNASRAASAARRQVAFPRNATGPKPAHK